MPIYHVNYSVPEIGLRGYVRIEAETAISASVQAKSEFEDFAAQYVRGIGHVDVVWDLPTLIDPPQNGSAKNAYLLN